MARGEPGSRALTADAAVRYHDVLIFGCLVSRMHIVYFRVDADVRAT